MVLYKWTSPFKYIITLLCNWRDYQNGELKFCWKFDEIWFFDESVFVFRSFWIWGIKISFKGDMDSQKNSYWKNFPYFCFLAAKGTIKTVSKFHEFKDKFRYKFFLWESKIFEEFTNFNFITSSFYCNNVKIRWKIYKRYWKVNSLNNKWWGLTNFTHH